MLVRKEKTHSILWYSSAQHSKAKRRILRRSPPSPQPACSTRTSSDSVLFAARPGQGRPGQVFAMATFSRLATYYHVDTRTLVVGCAVEHGVAGARRFHANGFVLCAMARLADAVVLCTCTGEYSCEPEQSYARVHASCAAEYTLAGALAAGTSGIGVASASFIL